MFRVRPNRDGGEARPSSPAGHNAETPAPSTTQAAEDDDGASTIRHIEVHRKGSELVLANYPFRNPRSEIIHFKPKICLLRSRKVRDERSEQYPALTETDLESRTVKRQEGWPEDAHDVPEIARAYWSFRQKIHSEEGLVKAIRADRLTLAERERRRVLSQLHSAHTGSTKMKLRTRFSLRGAAMTADIKDFVARCEKSHRDQAANAKEAMTISELPKSCDRSRPLYQPGICKRLAGPSTRLKDSLLPKSFKKASF